MRSVISIILTTLILTLLFKSLNGQSTGKGVTTDCPQERIVVHLSHDYPFTGEILWFKIYCISRLFPQRSVSSLGFIELISPENTSLLRKKVNLVKGEGSGEFEIPRNIPTGIYYIIAYTSWMKNFGEGSFFRKEIAIVNPFEPITGNSDSLKSGNLKEQTGLTSPDISLLSIVTDKNEYSPRQRVSVTVGSGTVSGRMLTGSLSVSVYRKEPALLQCSGSSAIEINARPGKMQYLPDYNGIVMSGTLSDQSGNSVPGARLIMSYPGPGTVLESAVTGGNGEFSFILKPGEGDQDIVITLPDNDMEVNLEEPFWNGFRTPPARNVLNLDRHAIDYLNEKFRLTELQGRFNGSGLVQKIPYANTPDSTVFYNKPYRTIILANYVTLDSLQEYFHELIPSVSLMHRRGTYSISVLDDRTLEYLDGKSSVFLDGVFYDDYAEIANLAPAEVHRVSVLPAVYYYNDFMFGGIIDIHTKKSDFTGVKKLNNMVRFIYPKAAPDDIKFTPPDYSEAVRSDRNPDLRYLLAWEPYLKADNSKSVTFSFFTCDITGKFIIKVTAVSNQGEILQAEKEITVSY